VARKAIILCHVKNYLGEDYAVREILPTAYGFEIYIGWPVALQRGPGAGGPKVILTSPLAGHLEATRLTPGKHGLPIGKTVLRRLRAELELNYYSDRTEWWEENPDGPGEKYSTKSVRRKKMGLPSPLWTEEEDKKLLTLREKGWSCSVIAEKMSKTSHAIEMRIYRLRKKGSLD
jgi:hypothetical protein